MKKTAWLCLMALVLIAPPASAEAPRLLNVQGVLTDDAGAVLPDDTYTVTFKLYDVPTGGTPTWTTDVLVVQQDGVFSAVLGVSTPLYPELFTDNLWMALQLPEDTEMLPRIQLTGTPYAIRASSVDPDAIGAAELAPNAVVRSLNGLQDNVALVAGANVSITQVDTSLVIAATGGSGGDDGDWIISGDDLYHYDGHIYVLSTGSGRTDDVRGDPGRDPISAILTVSGYNEGIVATMSESDNVSNSRAAVFGKRTRTAPFPGEGYGVYSSNAGVTGYNLWGDNYTFGVSGYTWFDAPHTAGILGADNTATFWTALAYYDEQERMWGLYTPNSAFVGGTAEVAALKVLTGAEAGYVLTSDVYGNATWQPPIVIGSDGDWTISGDHLFRDFNGTVAIGTDTPEPLYNDTQATLQVEASVWPSLVLDATYGGLSRWAIIGSGLTDELWIGQTDQAGQIPTPLLRLGENEASLSDGDGDMRIRMFSEFGMGDEGGSIVVYGADPTAPTLEILGRNSGYGGGQVRIANDLGNDTVVLTGDHMGSGLGRVQTSVLEITGGSDLSEQFDVTEDGTAVEPGMVVSIDPERPGHLTISDRACDRRVAGVVSGAGGVKTGMLMGQQGSVADGELPVALAGRVFVWADTSAGPIQPGDLLTTSACHGHAMRVTDQARASGAILGKAMTGLDEGRGLVLVLVSLQ